MTKSYWPGWFGCYQSSDLRGSRVIWSTPSAAIATTSAVRVAGVGPRLIGGDGLGVRHLEYGDPVGSEEGLVLRPGYVPRWQELRAELEARREARREQRCFRHDPAGYLRALEQQCLQLLLPA